MTHTNLPVSNLLQTSQAAVLAAQKQLDTALGGMNIAQGNLAQQQQLQAQAVRPAVVKNKQFKCKRGPVAQAQRFNHLGPNVMGGGCKTPNGMMPQQFMGTTGIPQPVVGLPAAPIAGQPVPTAVGGQPVAAVPAQVAPTPAVPTAPVPALAPAAAQAPALPVAQQQAVPKQCGCSGEQASAQGFNPTQWLNSMMQGFNPMQGFGGSQFGSMFGAQPGFGGLPFGAMFGAQPGFGGQPMAQGFGGSQFGSMFGAQPGFGGLPFGAMFGAQPMAQGFNPMMGFGGQQTGGMGMFGGGCQYAQNGGQMGGLGQSWGQQAFNPTQQQGGGGLNQMLRRHGRMIREGFAGLSQQIARQPASAQVWATPAQPTSAALAQSTVAQPAVAAQPATVAGVAPEQQNRHDFAKDVFAGLTRTANSYGQMIASATPDLRPSLLQSQQMHNDYAGRAVAALQTGSIYKG
jgi:hypothetical protein